MKSIPWSPEEDERLRKLALSGLSMAEIAHELRRNRSSVNTRAAKLKIMMARDRNPMQARSSASSSRPGLKAKGK
jgi:hypothetical protein